MSTEENKALVRHFYAELNQGNIEGMLAMVADNAIDHTLPPGFPQGPEGVKLVLTMLFTTFTDNTYTIEDMIAEGDKVVTRFTNTSTQKGEFMGLPATGKTATKAGIDIFRIEKGKLVEHWIVEDFLGMLQQLGYAPTPFQ